MSAEDGMVHLWDLPRNETYLDLNGEYKTKMLQTARKIAGSWKNLSKILNVYQNVFFNIRTKQKAKLDVILKLFDYLSQSGFPEYSLENIEKNVIVLGTKSGNAIIKNPRLPFNLANKDGCQFISAILFDGGMVEDLKPYYGNTCLQLREKIKDCAVSVFGEIENKESNPNRGFMIRFPKIIGTILNYCLNVSCGQKVYTNPTIPEFIFNSFDESKRCFLRQAFDDDGWVSPGSREVCLGIRIDTSNVEKKERDRIVHSNDKLFSPNLLLGVKKLLEGYGIRVHGPNVRGTDILSSDHNKTGPFYRVDWGISISDRKSIENFSQLIGFELQYKQMELKDILKSYEKYQLPKGQIYNLMLQTAFNIERENEFFTKLMLAKKLGIGYSYATRIVRSLKKQNLVKETEIRREHESARFVLTTNGYEKLNSI